MAPVYPDIPQPAPGQAVAVAPDVLWVRIGMPCPPWTVNCWLLRQRDGWIVVDTGPDTPNARDEWESVFSSNLEGLPVRRVLCTHHHFDHVGLARSFCARWGAPLSMTRAEWLTGRMLALQWAGEKPDALVRQEIATGLPGETAGQFWATRVQRCRHQSQILPDSFVEMRARDVVETQNGAFHVVVASGHSPAAVLLHDVARGILISGDQLLPRITPFIGVDYMEPEADPLGPYLDWLAEIAELDHDPLVLPSHGPPFLGMTARADEVRHHHSTSLARLVEWLDHPRNVQDLTVALFGRCQPGDHLAFATQECLAHLHRLEASGRIRRIEGSGVVQFVACRDASSQGAGV